MLENSALALIIGRSVLAPPDSVADTDGPRCCGKITRELLSVFRVIFSHMFLSKARGSTHRTSRLA